MDTPRLRLRFRECRACRRETANGRSRSFLEHLSPVHQFEPERVQQIMGGQVLLGNLRLDDFDELFLHLAEEMREEEFAEAFAAMRLVDLVAEDAEGRL